MLFEGNWGIGGLRSRVRWISCCYFLKKNGTLSPADLANDENKNLPRPRVPLSPSSVSSSSSSPASLIEAVPRVSSPSSPHILAAVRFQQNRRTLFPFAVVVVVGLCVVGPGGCPARS